MLEGEKRMHGDRCKTIESTHLMNRLYAEGTLGRFSVAAEARHVLELTEGTIVNQHSAVWLS
jgi:hypothetical protein